LHITTTCLAYLSFSAFRSGSCSTDEEYGERLRQNKFLDYAAKHWGEHARVVEAEVSDLACTFLLDNGLLSCAAQVQLVPNYKYQGYSQSFPVGTKLHCIARFGLSQITQDLLSKIEDEISIAVNTTDSRGRAPLSLAAENGHDEMAKLLLDKGAEINAQGGEYGNALQAASYGGNEQVVKLLLDKGAEINTQGGEYGNALFTALVESQEGIARLLLEGGADRMATDARLKGAMHHAINNGHCKVSLVEMLLNFGVPVDTVDTDNMTPLHYSIKHSHKEVAERLLDRGVHIDSGVRRKVWSFAAGRVGITCKEVATESTLEASYSSAGLTTLHFACLTGNSTMTRFLLEHGANPNALSEYGEAPLHLALRTTLHGTKYEDDWTDTNYRAEVLWDFTDFEDEDDMDATVAAISQHRITVLDALLSDSRTNVGVEDYKKETPLHCIQYKRPDIAATMIQKLISRGADPFVSNWKQQTALHLACGAGELASVSLLLSLGADVSQTDAEGLNALHYAARSGKYKVIVEILENERAKAVSLVGFKDLHGKNALHHLLSTTGGQQAETVKLLIRQGVNGSELEESGASPMASYLLSFRLSIDTEICRLLLEVKGNESFIDSNGQTLGHLCAGASGLDVKVLNILKDFGVDMRKKDQYGRTMLHCAAMYGHLTEESLDFLLNVIGIELVAEDSTGRTALQYAIESAAKTRNRQIWDAGRWQRTKAILLQHSSASIERATSIIPR
jgi:ankyrin repeat protein